MSAVSPEGEYIFFHKSLKTQYFDPSNKAHFYGNLLVEVVYNDYFDGRWKEGELWLPKHERAEEQSYHPPRLWHSQTRFKYMYVGYGDSPETQNDHRRIRLYSDFSHSTSLYAGSPPRFVYLVLPMPTLEERWIWLDLSFPLRAIYIPKAHHASPTMRNRCSYYALRMAEREVSVPLKYGMRVKDIENRTTHEKRWYFKENRERGWWVWRTPDKKYGNTHPSNDRVPYVYEQVQMSAGFDITKLAMQLALLEPGLFDGDYQRIYNDCVRLRHNVPLWHNSFCLNPDAAKTWKMQNSGPDGTQVASGQFATQFDYTPVEPHWGIEVLKGTIEFGASVVPVVGPILALGTHMFLEMVLNPDLSIDVQTNVLGNVAGVAAAVGRMSSIAKPFIKERILKNFQKLLAKRRRRVGPKPDGTRRNQGDQGKKPGTLGTETGGGVVGGGLGGTGTGLTKGDDLDDQTNLMVKDPNYEVSDDEDEDDEDEDDDDFDLEGFLDALDEPDKDDDLDLAKFLRSFWESFQTLVPDWKDTDLGNLTNELWDALNKSGLKPGDDDPSQKIPKPDKAPIQPLTAGSGSDFELDFRSDGAYLVCIVTDLDDDEHTSEIRLDDHIGNQDGKFKWGSEDFSYTAQDISLSIEGPRYLLSASLLGLDDQFHPRHCIDLVGGIGIQDGELVRLEIPKINADDDEDDDEGDFDADDNDQDENDDDDNVEDSTSNRLSLGRTLEFGDRRTSTNGDWTLIFQGNGNLVLYNHGRAYWHSDTTNNSSGTGSINARIEPDGNFVVGHENGGRHRWESHSNGYGAVKPYILVQDDGNVCLYDEEVEGCHWSARNI